MKKFTLIFLGLFTVSCGFAADSKLEFVSIDSMKLMQNSKEGKKLVNQVQREVTDFQKEVSKSQQELANYQEQVTKQAKVLSKEALMEKAEKLNEMKKRAERDLSDREESLKRNIQKRQVLLRDKQLKIVKDEFEKKNWGMMIDKNTPGVLFVKKAIDKTDEILKIVDQLYEKETAKKLVSIEKNKRELRNA